jgi:hypothetical protein
MALSNDLRKRVVGAVLEGGMSRNAAAKRFGVSIASVIRWKNRPRRPLAFALTHQIVEVLWAPGTQGGFEPRTSAVHVSCVGGASASAAPLVSKRASSGIRL